MDGSKVVRYYDAKNRSIKVSRNVTSNEDEELRALDIMRYPVYKRLSVQQLSNWHQHQKYLNPKPLSQGNFGKLDLLTL